MESPRRRIVHDSLGLNTGEWPATTAEHFVTPVEQFFTRSHAPVPAIDPATWRLEVGGLVHRPIRYSLQDLTAAFPEQRVTATLVCAGLRRAEFLATGPLPGELPWGPEPVSTGEWSGISLADLLLAAGIAPGAGHVELVGLDSVERHGRRFGFGGSIDLEKALGAEVLLATGLNGRPLTPEHGFPLRAVVPGWIGARSVKWLGAINLLEHPSTNYFQASAYRMQRTANPESPRDVSGGEAMREVPLNAVILDPVPGQVVSAGSLTVRGWAMGSGGSAVTSVQLSADDGRRWVAGHLTRRGGPWSWSFWEATVSVDPGPLTLVARAEDERGVTQPGTPAETWNVKGYGNNAWYRVPVVASAASHYPSAP
jgi:sulfite oxidase